MANSISIHVEGGYVQLSCQIPISSTEEDIAAFIEELKFHMLGDKRNLNVHAISYAPRELNEKDAAKYIGRSVSFLRSFRLKGKKKRDGAGPKYTKDTQHCVRYPVKELEMWLKNRKLYASSCEELR
jgi:hypothetical protein